LAVGTGERIALLGPSGSGKTLLLRALALLDPLDCGEIRWQGRVVRRDMVPAFRRQVVYLHQRPAFSQETVETALMKPFALRAHGRRRYDREGVLDQLNRLGRDASFLAKRVRNLSGGEMQVVALLRAMQLDPTLLLLDEPTAALDTRTASAVGRLIAAWIDEAADRRAFIWVGHDETQSLRLTQRRLTLRSGRLAETP
jgi:putative ABC transport system ATP-binding protein